MDELLQLIGDSDIDNEEDLDNLKSFIEANKELLNTVEPDVGTPLMFLYRNDGDLEMIKFILDLGPNLEVKDNVGKTVLGYALSRAEDDGIEFVSILFENGRSPNVNNRTNKGYTPLMQAVIRGQLDAVKLLLKKGADRDVMNNDGLTALDYAKNKQIKELLLKEEPVQTGEMWKGYDKSDAQFFDSIVENEEAMFKKTLCPICLQNGEWGKTCKYTFHKCKPMFRNERLYNLYKDSNGDITWCAVCGRPCTGHAHYKLTDASETTLPPKLSYQPGADVYKAESCPLEGGGGTDEKIRRVDGLLRYICEVQDQVGKRSAKEVHDELVEEAWKAASSRIPKTVQDIKSGLKFKTYCDLPTKLGATAETKEVPNPNTGSPEVRGEGDCAITMDTCDKLYVFKHKQPGAADFIHEPIGKEAVRGIITQMGASEGCPIDTACKGILHPDEIKQVFEDEPQIYMNYKERFDRNNQKGGATGGSVTSPMDDLQCALKKKGGKTYRKGGKKRLRTYRKKVVRI